MNKVKRYIVNLAKKFEASEEAVKEAKRQREEREREEWRKKMQEVRDKKSELRKQIYDWYDELSKEFNINEFNTNERIARNNHGISLKWLTINDIEC